MPENDRFQSNEERLQYLDKQEEILKTHQEEDLLIDFDKAIEEHETLLKPYLVKFNGKIFKVPREMPFDFSVFFFRFCYRKVKGKVIMDIPEEKIIKFIELMFGNEMLQSLESGKTRVGMDFVFKELAMPIMKKWGYGVDEISDGTKKKLIQAGLTQGL